MVQNLKLSEENLDILFEIAFVLSFKKEELRYPKFHLYIPEKKNSLSNPIVNFKEKIYIDLSNLATLTRLGLGISQQSCALIIEDEEEQKYNFIGQDKKNNIVSKGIIKLESKDEFFQELLNNEITLGGLLLSIEAPGRLRVLYNLTHSFDMQLALVEGKVKVYFDPINNPLSDRLFMKIAENLESDREDPRKFNELKIIIQRVWHLILQLAVEFGHGSQFVIIPKKFNSKDKHDEYLNIGQYVTQPNLGEYIKVFFKSYYKYKFEEKTENTISKTLLTHYHQLLTCIDSIARLSTIDGSTVLDDSLSLIGFQGEIKIENDNVDPREHCWNMKIDISNMVFGMPRSSSNEEKSKAINFPKVECKKWSWKDFGTRHHSAARLCTNDILDPFVFVVSQTGDIREFMNLTGDIREFMNFTEKPTCGSVGIFGPLRPL